MFLKWKHKDQPHKHVIALISFSPKKEQQSSASLPPKPSAASCSDEPQNSPILIPATHLPSVGNLQIRVLAPQWSQLHVSPIVAGIYSKPFVNRERGGKKKNPYRLQTKRITNLVGKTVERQFPRKCGSKANDQKENWSQVSKSGLI